MRWHPCWRAVPSRYPPVDLFERVADPADLEAVYEIEALTNDRLRDQVGDLSLVPPADRVSGPHSSVIMAAFTHLNPLGSRFSDGSYGVFYAAAARKTAVAETRHHQELFMRRTNEAPMELDMRVYCAWLDGVLCDIRGRQAQMAAVYARDDYAASQAFAKPIRQAGTDGIVYDSVRLAGGQCAAVFRPPVIAHCRVDRHLCYVWDGSAISWVYEKRRLPR
ncbi:MAG: RES family NAD+ phosphorylase [Candidatus Eremiobacteraeota bacterium]|nr:RES family NAD+ phosphorylase [Candidatus Eremiobacteraeota bacterium]